MVTADLEPVSVESRLAWFEEHRPEHRPLWVVEQAGHIAAWLSFSSFYGRPAYAKTAELSMYVHDTFRRHGLASYLLGQAPAARPVAQGRYAPGLHLRPQPAEPVAVCEVRLRALGGAAEGCGAGRDRARPGHRRQAGMMRARGG